MTGSASREAGDFGFRSVVFDCDSTLVRIEGIDELAGARIEEVRRLTDLAMEGEVALEEVYGRRLKMIDPSRAQVDAIGGAYVDALVDDAREVVAALHWLGKDVRVVSGGLRPPVEAVADALGIAATRVAAVDIYFDADGRYRDYERDSPLSRNGGKPTLLAAWGLARPSLLVGDGATDLEGKAAVDCFAAFTGVVHRPAVAEGADVVVSAPCLAPILSLAVGAAERERLRGSEWSGLLERGDALLGHPLT